jgi:hypothetical protein
VPIFFTLWKQRLRKKKFKIITMEKKKIQLVHQKFLSINLRWGSFCKNFGRHNHGSCSYCGKIYTCSS